MKKQKKKKTTDIKDEIAKFYIVLDELEEIEAILEGTGGFAPSFEEGNANEQTNQASCGTSSADGYSNPPVRARRRKRSKGSN